MTKILTNFVCLLKLRWLVPSEGELMFALGSQYRRH